MKEEARETFLAQFSTSNTETLIGFAVMGGIFGEGIDLVGDRLIGATYKDFIHSPLVEELTELERKELEAIMVNKMVGPGGHLAITVDEELTEKIRQRQ